MSSLRGVKRRSNPLNNHGAPAWIAALPLVARNDGSGLTVIVIARSETTKQSTCERDKPKWITTSLPTVVPRDDGDAMTRVLHFYTKAQKYLFTYFIHFTMKIHAINTIAPYNQSNHTSNINTPKNKPQHANASSVGLPHTNMNAQLLNFNGGASLNLKATIENLEFLGASFNKMETIFPPKIKQAATELLACGNPQNKKLVDVHKGIFGELKGCSSLEDIKALFKEEKFFDDVLSASDIEFRPESYSHKLVSGENPYFTKDEDLSVQLIKLYWGDGFSLTDLKTYTDGKDINYLLNKLNIPKRDKHYGYYLKLSDAEYNERITQEMKLKRMETMDRKAAQNEGEPVYIPRGPLSDLHKQHISEGLIRYYQENPFACYNISKRQLEFYEKNPEQRLVFKEVLKRAWGLKSAEGIKHALSKHLKKSKVDAFDITDPISMNASQKAAMKSFWANNDWARKAHSKNMQYGWKTVKEDMANPPYLINYPMGLISDVKDFAEARGINVEVENFVCSYNTVTQRFKHNEKLFKVMQDYTKDEANADTLASVFQYAIVKTVHKMAHDATPQNAKSRKQLLETITRKYQHEIYEVDPKTGKSIGYKNLNIDQAHTIFTKIQLEFRRVDPELENDLLTELTASYPLIKSEVLKGMNK